ncbi:MAG TPA: thiamine phosphate synthase [Pyrinomonadaceae bacterium]|jgi:thiamine-phosphate pyrophosphorylase|nr:thiamine phosphate synthase [Pyrinomonadaceae bacterium]
MPLDLTKPITYLITDGRTTRETASSSAEFTRLFALVGACVLARVSLVQLREKQMRPRVLYELTRRAADLTRGSETRLLVNDRADIALAAGADGVHLTARSLDPLVVRNISPRGFLIGVSTHTLAEARAASASDADFAVFGPVFDTPSKQAYGAPLGLAALREATHAVAPFPILALGGITRASIPQVMAAGARGVAAIRLFGDESELETIVKELRESDGE